MDNEDAVRGSAVTQLLPGSVPAATAAGVSAFMLGPLPDLSEDDLAKVIAARFLAGYAGHTRAAYRRDLAHYFDWCDRHGVEVLAAGRSTVEVYLRHLADPTLDAALDPAAGTGRRPLAPATIARRLVAVAGLYRYAVAEGALDRNPADYVRRPRLGHDSPTLGLDRSEARRFLAAAHRHGPRAEALLTLLLHDGLRITEALAADVTDLGTVHTHRVLTIVRKGGARRQVVLNAAVTRALDTYLAGRTEGPLFATHRGPTLGRFDRAEAWRLVRRVATDAGLDADHLSPHSLRHTFVTLAREAGVPLEDVQDAAGHADPRTTRRYDRGRHNLDRSPAHALVSFLAP